MKFIDSTYEIFYLKLKDVYNERLVNWAIDMLAARFDSEHLRILAGAEKPYHSLYLRDVFDNICRELKIDIPGEDEIITGYHKYIISLALEKKLNTFDVLSTLHQYSHPTGQYKLFWSLYNAWSDLKEIERYPELRNYLEPNIFWEGAIMGNIESIVLEEFKKWKEPTTVI